jgi:hypothetical protein
VKRIHDDSLNPTVFQVNAVNRAYNAQRGIRQEGREL